MSDNQTIELRSYYPDKTQDISSSRIPLVKREEERKINNLQLQIEREFRKFSSISSLKKIMFYIYKCLFVEVIVTVFHAYQLIIAVMDISNIGLSFLYLIVYLISMWNSVLYLKNIITYNDYKKELDKMREENVGLNEVKKKKIHKEESFNNVTIYLNKPMLGIKINLNFRLFTWVLKYFVYVLLIYLRTVFPVLEYFTIFLMLVEYILIKRLSFKFKVLMRIEAYKELYNLEEPS
jgi:hypothetical protein